MMRIAMWSGPRNLSTAMMYSFGARSDCAIWDEPFYGTYLSDTGLDHPLRDETIAAWPKTQQETIRACLGPIPNEKPVFYQKHMTHHMLDDYDLEWTASCRNVFLIRHPARVIASYVAKRENPTAQDIGFQRQADLFTQIGEISGEAPLVIDASDIREDPETALRALCGDLGLEFQSSMLSWPKGGRKEDGPWARHWYPAVHNSTGFAGAENALPEVTESQRDLYVSALECYDFMRDQITT